MKKVPALPRSLIRAILDAFRPPDCPIPTDQATERALGFIAAMAAGGSDRVDEVRALLTGLEAALVFVDRQDRAAVRQRLTEMEEGRFLLGIGRREMRGLARFAQRLATMVLYATLDANGRPTAAEQLGYRVFEDRTGHEPPIPQEPLIPSAMFSASATAGLKREFDVIVVGSGAAGAVMTRLLVEAGLDVALVEAGSYVPEGKHSTLFQGVGGGGRPQPHDELEGLLRYYKHAGLQISTTEQPMFVFQGECLGGTSVINNAVCFRMPDPLRVKWTVKYGAAWATDGRLDAAYQYIGQELGIGPADLLSERLNPSGAFLQTGAAALNLGTTVPPVAVNVGGQAPCLGCGYCNLTCAYLRKNSVLQTMLPAAVRSAQGGTGRLTIFIERRAVSVMMDDKRRVTGVRIAEKRDPRRHSTIKGRRVVLCAGAVASSVVLQRTPAVAALGLPLGRRFSMNFGSPVHADYAEPVNAFEGLQIGHYYDAELGSGGFVVETWFNPPAAQSLALPGWMDALDGNLRRYRHLACAAPLVGSKARSVIEAHWSDSGEDIRIRLDDEDLAKLKRGLTRTCELLFHSEPKPLRVLLGTLDDWEVSPGNYRDRIERLRSWDEIQVGTGHPQGGNCLSHEPGNHGGRGVVGPDFRVYGARNLFVADASVFPTSLGVNPQWTVMALATLAAKEVLATV